MGTCYARGKIYVGRIYPSLVKSGIQLLKFPMFLNEHNFLTNKDRKACLVPFKSSWGALYNPIFIFDLPVMPVAKFMSAVSVLIPFSNIPYQTNTVVAGEAVPH